MARQKPTDEIEFLRKQREQLDARLKAAEARRKEKDRRDDQRRKAIAGTLTLEYIAANRDSEFTRVFAELLDTRISRPQDRALFAALLHPAHWENGQAMAVHTDEVPAALPPPAQEQ